MKNMTLPEHFVQILGTRGSVPVSGPDFARYGGATTCVLVRLDGRFLVLDAGTGILNLPEDVLAQPALSLLLTHPHLDHLAGLPACPYLYQGGAQLTVYAESDTAAAASSLAAPPYWPVPLRDVPARVRFSPLTADFLIGSVRVETIPGDHPGGTRIVKLTGPAGRRTVVLVTDCTLTPEQTEVLTDFARGCDLLLCDGQYTEEEWPRAASYGHSTQAAAARLGQACGARQVRVIHHDPRRTDTQLDQALPALRQTCPHASFAYEGEVIEL